MAFDQSIADRICLRLMNGESLRSICSDEGMPARSSVHEWLIENQQFADQYARAREVQADTYADEIVDISDDGSNDYMTRTIGETEAEVVNPEAIQRSKLRVEARKWVAAKLRPKKYGDAQLVKLGDADGNSLDLAAVIAMRRRQAIEGRGGDES